MLKLVPTLAISSPKNSYFWFLLKKKKNRSISRCQTCVSSDHGQLQLSSTASRGTPRACSHRHFILVTAWPFWAAEVATPVGLSLDNLRLHKIKTDRFAFPTPHTGSCAHSPISTLILGNPKAAWSLPFASRQFCASLAHVV